MASRGQLKAIKFLELVNKEFSPNFAKYDLDGSGAISTDEFEKALVSMNLNLAPHQLRDIFSVIDTNGDGQLSIQELEAIGADKSGILGRTLSPGQNKAREFLALIHKQFKVDFAKYDTDGNGVLTQEEFKAAISSLGLELLPHQLRDIFSLIDTDGNGELSLLEIQEIQEGVLDGPPMKAAAPPAAAAKSRSLSDGQEKAKKFLELVFAEFGPNFHTFDKDGSGTISYSEFESALATMDLTLRAHQLKDLFTLIDADGDGQLSVEELHAYSSRKASTPSNTPKFAGRTLTDGQQRAKQFLEIVSKEFSPNFAKYDLDGSGSISYSEFQAALESMDLKLKDYQLNDIFTLIDADGDGELSCDELHAAGRSDGAASTPAAAAPASSGGGGLSLEVKAGAPAPSPQPRLTLASPVGTPGLTPGQCKALQFIELLYTSGQSPDFTEFDTNGDGFISAVEFKVGLNKKGFSLKDHQVADVFSIMDSDGDEKISYLEFETLGREYQEVHALHKEASALSNTAHWDTLAMP